MGKLMHLPTAVLTPEVVLQIALERLPNIKSVVLCVHWEDGTYDFDWSQMTMAELCMASVKLGQLVAKTVED